MNVLETSGLAKRYRNTWALRDCTLSVPAGRIVALVGPNGAGKTTLLHCGVGLCSPTQGTVTVLNGNAAGSLDALERVAFVAQDAPLYKNLSVRSMLAVTANLNSRFDQAQAMGRLGDLEISLDRKVGKLSGGQQAQLALTLALARDPDLLVLDEPLARLDPLARHDFMGLVMAAVATRGFSVIFSSHVVSELERFSDYLIVLAHGRVQMVGDIDDLLASHAILSGPAEEAGLVAARFAVVQTRSAARRAELLVRTNEPVELPSGWESDDVSLEELVLAYLRDPSASMLPGPPGLEEIPVTRATR
ncbi:MAG: ABC transporter ATP-binding protein [Acidimicrobiales bacterium]|jgi:ABC-2 type transport system ATP-binding protein